MISLYPNIGLTIILASIKKPICYNLEIRQKYTLVLSNIRELNKVPSIS